MKYHLYAPAAAVGGIRAVSPSLSLPTYLLSNPFLSSASASSISGTQEQAALTIGLAGLGGLALTCDMNSIPFARNVSMIVLTRPAYCSRCRSQVS